MEDSGQIPASPPGDAVPPSGGHDYPLTFSVDYPDRNLDRLSTAFRIFWIIPIAILAATLEGGSFGANAGGSGARYAGGGIGILFIPVLLMLLFRKKYPRWWYDWNLQLTRFSNRIAVYFALMNDRYPSTDEEQAVHLNFPYPNAEHELTGACRWSSGCWRFRTTSRCSSSRSARRWPRSVPGSRSSSPAATRGRCLTSSKA